MEVGCWGGEQTLEGLNLVCFQPTAFLFSGLRIWKTRVSTVNSVMPI